jgi:vacuolar-type H+-ATPase subunit H
MRTVDGVTSHEFGEFSVTLEDDAGRDDYDSHRLRDVRDVLDRETIDEIENMHGGVVRAEAEQRFGLLRGKRTRQVAEAEAAEQAFLNKQGFATYNDFRLRIRRSTVEHEQQPATVWSNDLGFDDGFEPVGALERIAGSDDSDGPHHTATPDAAHDDERSLEGSEQMSPLPKSAPAPAAPPPVPTFDPKGDADIAGPATADLRRLTEPLFATLQAETDRFVASRIEAAEKQATDIVNRATKEAAEIIGRAARMHDAVKSFVNDVARESEAFVTVTEHLPSQIAMARDRVATGVQALRDLPENAGDKGGPGSEPTQPARAVPVAEPPASVWAAPPRVAPPPPMSSVVPPGV